MERKLADRDVKINVDFRKFVEKMSNLRLKERKLAEDRFGLIPDSVLLIRRISDLAGISVSCDSDFSKVVVRYLQINVLISDIADHFVVFRTVFGIFSGYFSDIAESDASFAATHGKLALEQPGLRPSCGETM